MILSKEYGTHVNICYTCSRYFCHSCRYYFRGCLRCCDNCDREYCSDCIEFVHCGKCLYDTCSGCSEVKKCIDCEENFCLIDCKTKATCCGGGGLCDYCAHFLVCGNQDCQKMLCENCCEDGRSWDIAGCSKCKNLLCSDCRFSTLSKEWEDPCPTCLANVGSQLVRNGSREKETWRSYTWKSNNCERRMKA